MKPRFLYISVLLLFALPAFDQATHDRKLKAQVTLAKNLQAFAADLRTHDQDIDKGAAGVAEDKRSAAWGALLQRLRSSLIKSSTGVPRTGRSSAAANFFSGVQC